MPDMCIMIFIVDGNWSPWDLGPCSKTCGGGIKHDIRVCDNPKPSCGGKKCEGPSTNSSKCNEICCPGKILLVLATYLCSSTQSFNYVDVYCVLLS